MMRYLMTLVVLVGVVASSTVATAASKSGDVIDHEPFTELLDTYVDDEGQIAYDSWHNDEAAMSRLDTYVAKIADASVDGHSRDAKLAFYLNAYNALVLNSILEAWPVSSPKDIDGFFEAKTHRIADDRMTLDHLEHKLIRPEFDEPRIHFVVVCAAASCPRLRQEALTADSLERQLESATREFVSSATRLESTAGEEGQEPRPVVVTSKLFDWFDTDFRQAKGSVRAYLSAYVTDEVQSALQNDADITFRSYDWSINGQSDE
jgi:hypothetical protein